MQKISEENATKMSLESIEKICNTTSIKDPKIIEDVLKRFLNTKYYKCTVDDQTKNYPCKDICNSFDLDINKLFYESTLKEFLTLMGYQYNAPHLIPFCDDLKAQPMINQCAINPLNYLLMLRMNLDNPNIKLFEHIHYGSFISYLDNYNENSEQLSQKEKTARRVQLGKIFYATKRFCEEYGSRKIRYVNIGDIIRTVRTEGSRPWIAGCMQLEKYVDKVTQAYSIAQALFLDCIRMNLINSDRYDFRNILNKYSESEYYSDDFWNEIMQKKETCYENEEERR